MGSKLFLGFAILCLVGSLSAFVLKTEEQPIHSEVSSPEKRFFLRPIVITSSLKFCPFYMVLLGYPECSIFGNTAAATTTTPGPAAADGDKGKDDTADGKDKASGDDDKKDDDKKDDEKKDDDKKDDDKKDDEKKDDDGSDRK